jgi:aspartyl-tRNA(Asn)/glutamyl-tRNA(Gln) amidotransferase subunit A
MINISAAVASVRDSGVPDTLVAASLSAIEQGEPRLACLLHSDGDFVEAQLQDLGTRMRSGENLPLAGLPIILKDNICVRGQATTCASKMLSNFVPPYDATVWERLRQAGAILVGKANMDEFAMGSSTENSAFGVTRNPWDPARVPGGSSGGSAAAVAAGYVLATLGSDTGGSIRQPAAFCGVTGLKPTYGRVSRYGLVAFASSLDQIGPITHTATDAALILSVIGGYDPRDATSAEEALPPNLGDLEQASSLGKVRLALPDVVNRLLPEDARQSFESTLDELRAMGVDIVEVALPYLEEALAAYYVIAPAEASSNLARYDGVRYGARPEEASFENVSDLTTKTRSALFGGEVKRRIMLGTYTLSAGYYDAYYNRAQKVRTALRNAYDAVLSQGYLAVLTPTTPGPAFAIGEKVDDPVAMYLSDIFTVSANLTGLPAVSIPSGFSREGMPLGVQLQGKAFAELDLLTLARDYQRATDHHAKRPKTATLSH